MAKSIRSKRKRHFRALKREKYAKKELVKLKKLLGVEDAEMKDAAGTSQDTSGPADAGETATQDSKPTEDTSMDVVHEDTCKMDVDRKTAGKKNISMKDLRDEHGTYPVWVSGRQIKKAKARRQGKKAKRAGKGRRTVKGKGMEW